MLRTPILPLLALLAIAAGLMPGGFALGSVEHPVLGGLGAEEKLVHPGTDAAAAQSAEAGAELRKNRRISSYYQELQAEVFSKLRPVERDEPIDFDEARALLSGKTTNEKIFNKGFEGKMRGEYASRVAPLEKTVNNPIWRPSYFDVQRYEAGRHDLAQWTTREVMEDQLKDFFNGGDQDSGAMKAVHTARALTGGEDEKPSEPALTPEQKIARAHRTDLPQAHEEESVPTKLKTKLNVLRQNGSIVFSNPVAITSLNGNRDEISLNMNREFRKLTLRTNAGYGVKNECLNVNVNKKITDHVSLDLDHYNYTGDKRGSAGEKTREQARVNYSIGF